jgi:hypothetical protein
MEGTSALMTSGHSLLILPGADRIRRTAPSWVWHLDGENLPKEMDTRLPRFHRASPSTALDKYPENAFRHENVKERQIPKIVSIENQPFAAKAQNNDHRVGVEFKHQKSTSSSRHQKGRQT